MPTTAKPVIRLVSFSSFLCHCSFSAFPSVGRVAVPNRSYDIPAIPAIPAIRAREDAVEEQDVRACGRKEAWRGNRGGVQRRDTSSSSNTLTLSHWLSSATY